jgi:hypothetical protein
MPWGGETDQNELVDLSKRKETFILHGTDAADPTRMGDIGPYMAFNRTGHEGDGVKISDTGFVDRVFTGATQFTMGIYFRWVPGYAALASFVGGWNGRDGSTSAAKKALWYYSSGNLRLIMRNGADTGDTTRSYAVSATRFEKWSLAVCTYNAGTVNFFIDGEHVYNNTSAPTSINATSDSYRIDIVGGYRTTMSVTSWSPEIELGYSFIHSRDLSYSEVAKLGADPFGPVRKRKRNYFVPQAAAAPSGAGAQALELLAQSGNGGEAFSGAGAQTLSGLSQAGAGVMQPEGAGAQTLQGLAQSGVGAQKFTGSGAQALEPLVQAGAGSEAFSGTGVQTITALTQAGAGVMHPEGAGAQALALLAQAGVGVEEFIGSGAQTLQTLLQDGAGTHSDGHEGTGAQALQALIQAGAGGETFAGTGAQIVATLAQAGAGAHGDGYEGAGAQTLQALTQSALGAMHPEGSGAQSLQVLAQSGSGAEIFLGLGAQTLAALAQVGSAEMIVAAAGAQTLAALRQAGAGPQVDLLPWLHTFGPATIYGTQAAGTGVYFGAIDGGIAIYYGVQDIGKATI